MARDDIKLPRLWLCDGAVLQRDTELRVRGECAAHVEVEVDFDGRKTKTWSDADGNFELVIPPQSAGGPYTVTFTAGRKTLVLSDILVGDVWYCGGQSNMELPMMRVAPMFPEEIKTACDDGIRQFLIERQYDFTRVHDDYDRGVWEPVSHDTIGRFYATSYFFAKEQRKKHGVPIGLINCAVGGTPVEAWMSYESLARFPEAQALADECRDTQLVEKVQRDEMASMTGWMTELNAKDIGLIEAWHNGVPGAVPVDPTRDWALHPELCKRGAFWFETTFHLDIEQTMHPARLWLGCLRDSDVAYVNGTEVGTTGYRYPWRGYTIPAELLKEGENTVVVRVVSQRGPGGFVEGKRYGVEIKNKGDVPFDGWRYRVGTFMDRQTIGSSNHEMRPTGRFNAMLAPMLSYAIKGAIWYQGETNAVNPARYREKFTTFINSLRKMWGLGDFPFYFVQLANYDTPYEPSDVSGWREIREEQRRCLDIPNTGMAVIIDVGEDNDLHPLNKKAVGQRLALALDGVCSPMIRSAERRGSDIVVTFDHADGLRAEGELTLLLVSGGNDISVAAHVEGDTVIVPNAPDGVTHVRYAWANCPACVLYNSHDLPASPFSVEL